MAGFLKNNKGPGKIGRKNDDLWTKTGTFINKPNRGWIHPDERLKVGGICYGVRYVGCLEVKQSMRTLPFDMRGQVTKEAIFRVCDAAGFRYNRKKKAGKQVNKVLGELPNIQFGGANVNLTISTVSINLMIMETGKTIANHQMQGISFASGGDVETPDYVAYIAKDPVNARACHVIECSDGLAHDVITTIGQAFEIRFKEYLKNPPQAVNVPDRFVSEESAWGEDPEYYNDLSDFVPKPVQKEPLPEIPVANGLELQTHTYIYQSSKPNDRPMSDGNVEGNDLYDNRTDVMNHNTTDPKIYDNKTSYENSKQPVIGQLIDLVEATPAPVFDNPLNQQYGSASFESNSVNDWQNPNPTPHSDHYHHPTSVRSSLSGSPMSHSFDDSVYTGVPDRLLSSPVAMDTGVTGQNGMLGQPSPGNDPFDMEPFNPSPTGTGDLGVKPSVPLKEEIWFHGPMTRKQSEAKLEADGDFLVRESTTTPGQYVLSGMQSGTPKHLLLVDPEGKVRTKDKEFDSVSHLIDYHRSNKLPIISAGSAVHLKQPVISVEAGGR
ncbi:SHC-transforming protein 1-like isoform X3 [Anneissia japonica]|uniref:SHC-transforming protein 1-like isoform X3 n=1 Tax=Anneissia japonica TaxID=1529436 RepID=UPI0014257623|nr:SHC-transforming protein 1-like isoform X3 [Anneissia japonica]